MHTDVMEWCVLYWFPGHVSLTSCELLFLLSGGHSAVADLPARSRQVVNIIPVRVYTAIITLHMTTVYSMYDYEYQPACFHCTASHLDSDVVNGSVWCKVILNHVN